MLSSSSRERQRERYKIIINRFNYRIQSLHVGMQPPGSSVTGEQKKCWHMLGKKLKAMRSPTPSPRPNRVNDTVILFEDVDLFQLGGQGPHRRPLGNRKE